jgi:hypothetical protein
MTYKYKLMMKSGLTTNNDTLNSVRDEVDTASSSDSGSPRSSLQSLDKPASTPMLVILVMCATYGMSSTALTYFNKRIYATYPDVSPMSLLMVSCFINVLICLALMTYKEIKKSAFTSLIKFGIEVPELNKIMEKSNLGLKFGLSNFASVIFSMCALKLTSIPL